MPLQRVGVGLHNLSCEKTYTHPPAYRESHGSLADCEKCELLFFNELMVAGREREW